MATLYIVGTPIGNLDDLSIRAVSVLSNVDIILAEDTRVTRKLLDRYNIKKEVMIYHQHSDLKKIAQVVSLLEQGKNLALVSDAGTPGINDPGNFLIHEILKELPEVKVVPIPGANAAIASLSISGFPTDTFTFLGFPPHKKGRQTFFKNLDTIPHTVVFYESKYRIIKALEELKNIKNPRDLMVSRELTKQFETTYRGTAEEITMRLGKEPLGEFVVVLGPIKKHKIEISDEE
ncbi:16S rRNA (cytidine(1402)-2'-O)-methyltransferase [Candidatus Parcubacteria bacterium]|nr:16S rRNA (cytidine(1402)-2'-O)-methyltransferase [Candidatus Parcubacteria bacterium]